MTDVNFKIETPLKWPAQWPRTRPQDQKVRGAWSGTLRGYADALAIEMGRMKAPACVLTYNQATPAAALGAAARDTGVAVWFSRAAKEDFSWQDALGIRDPYPTEDAINVAFRTLARPHHPDIGGDVEMFRALARHRDNAIRWVRQREGKNLDFAIACDAFKETRLNLASIVLTIRAIRQIERCGTSALLERAFQGFAALPEASV